MGFGKGLLKDKFAFFEAYKNPIPKRRKLLAKRPLLQAKMALFKKPFKMDRVSFSTPEKHRRFPQTISKNGLFCETVTVLTCFFHFSAFSVSKGLPRGIAHTTYSSPSLWTFDSLCNVRWLMEIPEACRHGFTSTSRMPESHFPCTLQCKYKPTMRVFACLHDAHASRQLAHDNGKPCKF